MSILGLTLEHQEKINFQIWPRSGLPPHEVEKAESSSKNAEARTEKAEKNGNVRFCRLFEFCIVL